MTNDCKQQFDDVCLHEFKEINRKLDQMDQAVRGNGKPGILLRLDRLEQSEAIRSRLLWLIAGCVATVAASMVWSRFFG